MTIRSKVWGELSIPIDTTKIKDQSYGHLIVFNKLYIINTLPKNEVEFLIIIVEYLNTIISDNTRKEDIQKILSLLKKRLMKIT